MKLTNSAKERIRNKLKKYLDPDLIDIKALWDSKLCYQENVDIIITEAQKFKQEELERSRHETKMLAIKQAEYEREQAKKESQAIAQKWRSADSIVDKLCDHPAYVQLKAYVSMTLGDYSNGLICCSEGGLGKSTTVIQILDSQTTEGDYSYFNSYSTPLSLYKTLYDNRDSIIVLDDVEGMLNNKKCVSMLKACLWDVKGVRMIQYKTTSEKIEGYPESFEFTGKVIIIANSLGKLDPHLQAMVSRVNHLDIKLSYDERISLIEFIANNNHYKEITLAKRRMIYAFLEKNTDASTKDLNFRTLIKMYEFFRFDRENWRDLSLRMLEVNPLMREFINIHESFGGTVDEQAIEFAKRTGKSKRTFFRYQSRYNGGK